MMLDPVWQVEYAVETSGSRRFSWAYWSNVANWADPPAEFQLDGPFTAGSRGTTTIPGQESRHWVITEVHPERAATIEAQLPGAVLRFCWHFDECANGGTRITQQITLYGENAREYVEAVAAGFGPNLPAGMSKLATTIARAESEECIH